MAVSESVDSEETALPRTEADIRRIEQIDLERVPELDHSLHSVPLDEIIFDAFQRSNRAVSLTDAQPALIRSLRDAIPPICEPRFASAAETDQWREDGDLVL